MVLAEGLAGCDSFFCQDWVREVLVLFGGRELVRALAVADQVDAGWWHFWQGSDSGGHGRLVDIFVRTVVLKVGFLLIVRSCSCISAGNDKVCSKTREAKFQNVYIYLVDGSKQVRTPESTRGRKFLLIVHIATSASAGVD